MGVIIMPNKLTSLIDNKKTSMESTKESLEELRANINKFVGAFELSGEAYRAAKEKLQEYRIYIDAIEYRMLLIEECDARVKSKLSVFGGKEPVLESEYEIKYKEAHSAYMYHMKQSYKWTQAELTGGRMLAELESCFAQTAYNQEMLAQEWLDKINTYLAETNGIYAQINEIEIALTKCATAFKQTGYDQKTKTWKKLDNFWSKDLKRACHTDMGSLLTYNEQGLPIFDEEQYKRLMNKPASLLSTSEIEVWENFIDTIAEACDSNTNTKFSDEQKKSYRAIMDRVCALGYTAKRTKLTRANSRKATYTLETTYEINPTFDALCQVYTIRKANKAFSYSEKGEHGDDYQPMPAHIYAACSLFSHLFQQNRSFVATQDIASLPNDEYAYLMGDTARKNKQKLAVLSKKLNEDHAAESGFHIFWDKEFTAKDGVKVHLVKVYYGSKKDDKDYDDPRDEKQHFFSIIDTNHHNLEPTARYAQELAAQQEKKNPSREAAKSIGNSLSSEILSRLIGWDKLQEAVGITKHISDIYSLATGSKDSVEAYQEALKYNAMLDIFQDNIENSATINNLHVSYAGAVVSEESKVFFCMPGFRNDEERKSYEYTYQVYLANRGKDDESINHFMESTPDEYIDLSTGEKVENLSQKLEQQKTYRQIFDDPNLEPILEQH